MPQPSRKSTSMTLDRCVLEEACALGSNMSQAAQTGVVAAIRAERAHLWKQENAGAIAGYNSLVAQNGVPLSGFRKF